MKRLMSIILSIMLVISSLPMIVYANDENNGDISERYRELTQEYDNDKVFIESIVLSPEENTIDIDGNKLPMSEICEIADDEIFVPAEMLCEYIDAEIKEDYYGYDVISYAEREIWYSSTSGVYDVVTDRNNDITIFENVPYEVNGEVMLPASEIAEALGYDSVLNEDKLLLTRPYQSCRLLVSTAKKNIDPLNSVEVLRDEKNDITILQFENETDTEEAMEYYEELKTVKNVEPDLIVGICEDIDEFEEPDDEEITDFSYMLETVDDHLDSTASESIYIDDMNDYLRDCCTLENVMVAVVDTGVVSEHEALKDRIICAPVNFSDSGEKNKSEDDNGHGTHVAGIVVSNTLDNVDVLCVKALNDEGRGSIYQVYEGMQYAAFQGAKVINLSLGMYGESELLTKCVKEFWEKDITVVASAGNNTKPAEWFTPACIEQCITVAAIEGCSNGKIKDASFSNWGWPVDISAPGVNIYSTYIYDEDFDGYRSLSGTSMSAPFVTAVAGMLYSYDNSYSAEYVHNRIRDNGRKGGSGSWPGIHHNYYVLDCRNLIEVDRTPIPEASIEPGIYNRFLSIELSCSDENAEIYYTVDGTKASKENGTLYTEPIPIEIITRIHAVAYSEGKYKSLQLFFDYYLAMDVDENDFTIDDEGIITAYNYNDIYSAYMRIPEVVQGKTVRGIGNKVFYNNNDIRLILLPDTCESIGNYAFYKCTNLNVIKGDGVKKIGVYGFYWCQNLYDLDMPNIEELGKSSFYWCDNLPGFSNDKLEVIPDQAFLHCISLSYFDCPNVTKLSKQALYSCRNLEYINLPKLESIGSSALPLQTA